jgi:hypothetical protein
VPDRLAEDHRLVSLDTERGNRNVRRIEIGVGIVREKSQARSSVVEHYLDTVGVGGSIPPVPTIPLLAPLFTPLFTIGGNDFVAVWLGARSGLAAMLFA